MGELVRALTVHITRDETFPISCELVRHCNQLVEPGRVVQLPRVARLPAEEAIEEVALTGDDVP